jgi:hypothetical protein
MRWRRGIFLLKRCLNRVLPGCPFMFSNQKHDIEDHLLAAAIWLGKFDCRTTELSEWA